MVLTKVEKISKEAMATKLAKTYSSMLEQWISLCSGMDKCESSASVFVKSCNKTRRSSWHKLTSLFQRSLGRADTKLRESPVVRSDILKHGIGVIPALQLQPCVGALRILRRAATLQHFAPRSCCLLLALLFVGLEQKKKQKTPSSTRQRRSVAGYFGGTSLSELPPAVPAA